MTDHEMLETYNAHAGAHVYLLGFVRKAKVYYFTTDFAELTSYTRHSTTSSHRGGCNQIRIYIRSSVIDELLESGRAQYLCDDSIFEAQDSYNRGDHFERAVKELLTGEEWHKNKDPFWTGGDVRINGVEVQVKFNSAELTNENTLQRMLRALA